jgi:hypothetical protein
MLAVRENGSDRTAELTTAPALFIHGTPSASLGNHRLANADRVHGWFDRTQAHAADVAAAEKKLMPLGSPSSFGALIYSVYCKSRFRWFLQRTILLGFEDVSWSFPVH